VKDTGDGASGSHPSDVKGRVLRPWPAATKLNIVDAGITQLLPLGHPRS
jgi:hypothetical protein